MYFKVVTVESAITRSGVLSGSKSFIMFTTFAFAHGSSNLPNGLSGAGF